MGMNNKFNDVACIALKVISVALNFLHYYQWNEKEKWGKMNNLPLEQ